METTIHAIHFEADTKFTDVINEKIKKLHHFYDRIISTDVFLKLDHNSGPVKDKIVEIKVEIPNHTFYAESTHVSFLDAFDKSYEGIKSQVVRHKEKMRQ